MQLANACYMLTLLALVLNGASLVARWRLAVLDGMGVCSAPPDF